MDPITRHTPRRLAFVTLTLLIPAISFANDNLNVGVTISGEITPGVYGRVELGNNPPPPVIYNTPVIITKSKHRHEPVYLHVPPGHAMHWDKHCAEYNACDREVYFVRSSEYDEYEKKHGKGKKHGRGHDRDEDSDDDHGDRGHNNREHDHGHGHDD